jgi:hypothetical protein
MDRKAKSQRPWIHHPQRLTSYSQDRSRMPRSRSRTALGTELWFSPPTVLFDFVPTHPGSATRLQLAFAL